MGGCLFFLSCLVLGAPDRLIPADQYQSLKNALWHWQLKTLLASKPIPLGEKSLFGSGRQKRSLLSNQCHNCQNWFQVLVILFPYVPEHQSPKYKNGISVLVSDRTGFPGTSIKR